MSSLDNLRKAAKRWLRELRAGDAVAIARLQRVFPRALPTPGLRDVQHALALERGFPSWPALKQRVMEAEWGSSRQAQEPALTALFEAAGKGDIERVVEIADATPELVSQRGLLGQSGLRTALHFGVKHEAVVRALLERGADPNVRDEGDNAMPLHFAAENQDFAIIRLLVQHGADVIGTGDMHELDIIGWACCWDYRAPNKEIVDYLLAHGAKHHIFSAVTMGEVEAIRVLVEQDRGQLARRMDQTNMHRAPLHQAVIKQQPRSLAELIDLGADLEALDQAGLTALDQAALDGHQAIAQLLIERGAIVRLPTAVSLNRVEDIDRLIRDEPDALKPGQRFGTLIVRASRHSTGAVIEKLIQLGALVNVSDEQDTAVDRTKGYTPLHAAAFHGNEDAVRVLLKHGADVNAREEKYDSAAAGWANYAGHRHIRDLILREPIDIFQAIEFDVTERIPQLLKTDREALQRRLRGYTPLAWAASRNNIEAARFLIGEGAELGLTPDQEARLAGEDGFKVVSRLLNGRVQPAAIISIQSEADRLTTFVEAATWDHETHGKGDHRMNDRAAQRLLLQRPEMARHSLYTAIVCGDLAEVLRIVADDPAAATQRGGPRGWTPLLYLCYTRFSYPPAVENAVTIATALLDRGANPNDYYMAGHARYSALVGVAREGEQDAPPHPRRDELFKLLLERGARMYDIQVLYNTHFSGDVLWWLKLVHGHAMAMGRQVDWSDPDWPMFDMGGYGSGARFLLSIAIRKRDVVLARWLLEHGANPNASPPQARGLSKRSLYEEAQREGASEIAELLRRFGAAVTPTVIEEGEDRFVLACLRLDRSLAQRLLAEHPEYLASPVAMFEAASRDRADALELLVGLGASVDVRDSDNTRPLHHAAGANALAAAKFLVDCGAEIDPRERRYDAAPIGWAAHGDHHRMVDFLSGYSRNIWTLSVRGYVDRVRQILSDDPSLAKSTSADGITPLWWLPDNEDEALEIVDLLIAQGADPAARSTRGTTAADWAEKRGMTRVVTRLKGDNPRFRG